MKEIKIYEIPNIDFIERIDDPYIGMIFYVADIDAYYSVKTLKEINGINIKGSKVVEYVIDEYADFGTGSGGGSGLTATQLSNIAKIPAIQSTVDALPNNYASKDHSHSEYASSSHRHDASEIDNLPSGGGTGLTTEQVAQIEANKTAINNIMPLDFSNTDVVESIQNTVDEAIIKQEYLGGYIEIQPDSWDSVSCPTDDSTNIWGFPTSLSNSEQEVIKNDTLAGNGKGIMYIRFPLGFAYRGYRNIDETTRLAKNIGERFKGQNARLKSFFENISRAGGGLAPEYWCPPPYWVTGGAYYNADVPNYISAGGSYSQNTKLSSIITSDPTQYAAQIDAFTDAIVDDLEYLHQNIAPVRMFGLQNEPSYSSQAYGACCYDSRTYCDVLASLYPKIQSSPVLSVYNDEPNEVKLHVGSDDSANPWTGITATYIQQHRETIWGYSHHSMRKASGEMEYETGKRGADWYKSEDFSTIKYIRDNVFINEYEYFNAFAGDTDEFRCSNNMLRMINEFVYGGAKIIHPVIHLCKPLGQTASSTNTKGYCLYAVNLKGEYGKELTDSTNPDGIPKGSFTKNPTMYNSWAIIKNNLPIGAYLIGSYTNVADNIGYCAFKYHGKVYVFLANNGTDKKSIILTFGNEKSFSGKYYDLNNTDLPLAEKQGTTIEFVLPPYSGQCWIEKDNLGVEYDSKEPVLLTRLSANYTQGDTVIYPNTSLNSLKSNLVVTGTYSDGTTKTITNYTLSGTLTVGTSTVTISCNGLTTTFNVTVTEQATLQSITATYTQGSTIIYSDTALDSLKNNLTVVGNYSDGNTSNITDYSLSGTLSAGTSTITVSYLTFTTTFTVTVSEKPAHTLSSIKATYTQGDTVVYPNTSLNSLKNNLVVTGTYSDSSTATITDYTLSGTLTEGTSTITVSYNGKTTTFTVSVSASEEIRLLVEQGGINYATGAEEDSANKCRTDFIPVSGSTTTINTWSVGHVVRCYDTSKNFIGTIQGSVALGETTWTLLSNSAYIRLVLNDAVIDNVSGKSAIVDGQTYRFYK